ADALAAAGSGAAGLGSAGAGLDSNSVGASASADFAGFLAAREAVLRTRLTAVSPASGVWSDKWEFLARCERPEGGGDVEGSRADGVRRPIQRRMRPN